MNLFYESHLLRTLLIALSVGFSVQGAVAKADTPQNDIRNLRAYTERIHSEADSTYDAECEKAKSRALNLEAVRTTASERYEAALKFRQCVESRRSKLLAEPAPEATSFSGTMFAREFVHQAMKVQLEKADQSVQDNGSKSNFMGMTFGIGVGASFSSKEQITGAVPAADNTVRVTSRQKQQPRVILEAHYYGVCEKRLDACKGGDFGVGPFFGLAATGDALDAFALGVMFGWKSKGTDAAGGFSIGIGAVLDKEFQGLAPGFQEGAPLPPGETAVPLVKRSKWSPLLFFTKTF